MWYPYKSMHDCRKQILSWIQLPLGSPLLAILMNCCHGSNYDANTDVPRTVQSVSFLSHYTLIGDSPPSVVCTKFPISRRFVFTLKSESIILVNIVKSIESFLTSDIQFVPVHRFEAGLSQWGHWKSGFPVDFPRCWRCEFSNAEWDKQALHLKKS